MFNDFRSRIAKFNPLTAQFLFQFPQPSVRVFLSSLSLFVSLGIATSLQADEPPLPRDWGMGGRGPGQACVLAPTQRNVVAEVQGDRPFLAWIGSVRQIELRHLDDSILFTATASVTNYVLYEGVPLETGQEYEWWVYTASENTPNFVTPIYLRTTPEQAEVNAALADLDATLSAQNSTPDERLMAQIQYLGASDLWFDAMRLAFTADEPGETVLQYQQGVLENLCLEAE
jgi:hypothetical protein